MQLRELMLSFALCSITIGVVHSEDALLSMPDIDHIGRFEVIAEYLTDTSSHIVSSNQKATEVLLRWLDNRVSFPLDPRYSGSYRPILTVRFWSKEGTAPTRLQLVHEWKDASGRVRTLWRDDIDALFRDILAACEKK